jgi:hypothetical protein
MSSGGRVVSSSGCVTRPKGQEIGSTGYAGPTQRSLLIGHCVMATAEHREPCDSRGSCTVLGAPRGEIPPGDSTLNETASLIGRLGSSAFRLSTVAVSMSLARPLFSPESAPRALPIWDPKTRWNNLARGLAVSNTAGPSGFTNSPHPSSREGDHTTTRWNSSFLLLQLFRTVLMRRRLLPSSTGSRCHPSTCGA